ncbi:NAD(P)-binding Rossmann-fold superfamily protein [Rhynchospora pubera]|uniref:NAD(P)-binding Rossmann-fold superfamily protein n=1 Tax=Rhynchospora pubera TaxID=906938 RepID=A0AAV8HV61_9POAL|nr:NAD(P)-binding Rossmann-fold superfamily protein [Rhynchospora pubera]
MFLPIYGPARRSHHQRRENYHTHKRERERERVVKTEGSQKERFWCNKSCKMLSHLARLEGKVAIITGGASGLGKAAAQAFIREGAKVIIADVNSEAGLEAAEELGPEAQFFKCDVSDEQDVSKAVDHAVASHGWLDVMYNNAGITGLITESDVSRLDLTEFDKVMSVNVRGTLAGIKHAARVMKQNGSGSILCTASISGLMGGLGTYPYSISKSTIIGIVKTAANELAQHGIRVNCISPFVIPTPLVMDQFSQIYQGAGPEAVSGILNSLGVLRGAKCETTDVAQAAVYLASDDAKYVSGQNLVIDGGFTSFKHLNMPMPSSMS